MAKERAERLSELVKKEIGKIIFDTIDTEPGVLVTVTRVIVNSNLFTADVFVSVYPSTGASEILKKLDRLIYEIQQLLNKKLRVRPVPKIIFKYDKNPEEASKIEGILKEIEEK